jgi:two-component system, OmpR family, sensor histidine kinase KdpD
MNRIVLKYRYYAIAFTLLMVVTAASQLLHAHLDIINVTLIHLVPTIVIALRGEMTATMIVTTAAVLMLAYFYVPPYYSFHVEDLIYIWSIIIFYLVGYTITLQAKRIHANEIKQLLLNTLSHDLKTPLSSILGNTTLLLESEGIEADTRRRVLTEIKESSERMDRLIGTLLDNARLKHGDRPLHEEWCDLEDLLGVSLQEFHDEQHLSQLEIEVADDLPLFWGDSGLLVRLLVNLLENAFKYTDEAQRIRLSFEATKKSVRLILFNESRPIQQHDLRNIFERFYRLDNTADINGSGIGLAICKEIATAHQGTIEAYNVKGGVCFEVELPILKQPAESLKELL